MVDEKLRSSVITRATRSAVGSFNGAFVETPAHVLGARVIESLIKKTGLEGEEIDEVILGQVLTAGQGQNPARQAALGAGIPHTTPAWLVNQVCGSGLRSVALAAQQIALGDSEIIVAGGQENMSRAPHCAWLRMGQRMGSLEMIDTMIRDGLWDIFNDYHMGQTAENIAKKWALSREVQDQFALMSQNRAETAQKQGRFREEITPITIQTKKETRVVDEDEHPRHGLTLPDLAKLRPAFSKEGTVTAGNASGINDGAAVVLVMSEQAARARALTPLARIVSWATAGVDPALMGTGPIPAARHALQKAGWKSSELDLIETNEAFAAQALAVLQEMEWDPVRVNVNGGAIALGHPIGASGARILVTLLHEMERRDAKKGLATLCIGGGMGVALCVARD